MTKLVFTYIVKVETYHLSYNWLQFFDCHSVTSLNVTHCTEFVVVIPNKHEILTTNCNLKLPSFSGHQTFPPYTSLNVCYNRRNVIVYFNDFSEFSSKLLNILLENLYYLNIDIRRSDPSTESPNLIYWFFYILLITSFDFQFFLQLFWPINPFYEFHMEVICTAALNYNKA